MAQKTPEGIYIYSVTNPRTDRNNRRPRRLLRRQRRNHKPPNPQPKPQPPPLNPANRPRPNPIPPPQSAPTTPRKSNKTQHALPRPTSLPQQKPTTHRPISIPNRHAIHTNQPKSHARRLRPRHIERGRLHPALRTRVLVRACAPDAVGGALWGVVYGCVSEAVEAVG